MGPELIQHALARADGSAAISSGLYTVIAGVNGPVEVQRRDELPEESAIEVNIRPASGVGGPRERWLETVVQSVLKSVILVHMYPRTLIQVTLQVTKEPSTKFRNTAADISILPSLLNAAFTALVDGGLPLATTMSATLAAVNNAGKLVIEPQEKDVSSYSSLHAMAFNAHGEQLLDQSAGPFDMDTWDKVAEAAQKTCMMAMAPSGEDESMVNGDEAGEPWLRRALQERAEAANAWRDST